jgi:hypothetical protein
MSYTNELIDRYKIAIKVDSDYAVAKALGIRANRISNYRTGISHADDKTAIMLATVLHLDPMETIARINMDRSSDKDDKAFWRRFAGTAATLVVGIALALPGTAHAVSRGFQGATDAALCEMTKRAWRYYVSLLRLLLERLLQRRLVLPQAKDATA